jgi:hypothetical protein
MSASKKFFITESDVPDGYRRTCVLFWTISLWKCGVPETGNIDLTVAFPEQSVAAIMIELA